VAPATAGRPGTGSSGHRDDLTREVSCVPPVAGSGSRRGCHSPSSSA